MAEVNSIVVLPRSLATKAKAATPGSNQDNGSIIPRPNTQLVFETVRQLRDGGRKTAAIRKMARVDGNVSAAVYAFVQNGLSGYTLKAYTTGTHELDVEGTRLVRSIAASLGTLYDYTLKYSDKQPLDAVIETGLREVVLTGAFAAELVLNKQRLPEKVVAVAYEDLKWKKGAQGLYPVQQGNSGDIDLNISTFWVAESHCEANAAYSFSMLEGCLNSSFYFSEAIEDMRRAVRRSGHARILVKLDSEKVKASAPVEVQSDSAKLRAFMERTRDDIVSVINSLEPEDAIITFDVADISSISADGEKSDYVPLVSAVSGLLSTSLKTPPSILGLRLSGSQSLSNTESLIYLRLIKGIQRPVEQVMSRALTLSARLYGADVYVKFVFDPVELRPEAELEAFRVMEQDRVLKLLSLGFLSDEAAAERLGTGVRPPGAPALSGTMFMDMGGGIDATDASPNADPQGRALQSQTPAKGGGESQ